jgi:hypothetical protein
MSKNSLEEIEFEQTLNNFETQEDLELYRDSIMDEIEELESTIKVEEFKSKIGTLETEQGVMELEKDKVIAQMKENGSMLEYVGSKFQNDYDVVVEAVKTFEWALCYASQELQNDYEIVFQALQLNPDAIEYASDEMKMQEEFIKIYINYWVGEHKMYKTIDEFIEFNNQLLIDVELIREYSIFGLIKK